MRCKMCIFEELCQRLQDELRNLPRCEEHPDYPCVRTLVQGIVNDIISIGPEGVQVRSHDNGVIDPITANTFRRWYDHLCANGSASLVPGDPNNPDADRSRIVGAILAACFPDRIAVENNNTIRLV